MNLAPLWLQIVLGPPLFLILIALVSRLAWGLGIDIADELVDEALRRRGRP